jgi:uncharacterized membrane protein YdbT with pleckstrin-like domain
VSLGTPGAERAPAEGGSGCAPTAPAFHVAWPLAAPAPRFPAAPARLRPLRLFSAAPNGGRFAPARVPDPVRWGREWHSRGFPVLDTARSLLASFRTVPEPVAPRVGESTRPPSHPSDEPVRVILRPAFLPFLLGRSGQGIAGAAVAALGVGWGLGRMGVPGAWILAGLGFLVLAGGATLAALIRVRRTRWRILPDRITGTTGTAFSKETTELELDRITQISFRRPFLQGRLFGTGQVTVKAAGSGARHLVMSPVPDPGQVFETLQRAMRAGGFSLARSRVVSHERPAMAECLWAVGWAMVFRVVVVGIAILALLAALAGGMGLPLQVGSIGELVAILQGTMDPPDGAPAWARSETARWLSPGMLGLLVVGAVWILVPQVIRFLRLRRRHYRLFGDAVELEARFLGEYHQVIPVENLTDVSLRQSFRQRLMRTSDLELSCKGRTRTIRFPWMARAEVFSENLRSILEDGASSPGRDPGSSGAIPGASPTGSPEKDEEVQDGASPQTGTGLSGEPALELRISLTRVLTGYFVRALADSVSAALILTVLAGATIHLEPEFAAEVGDTPWVLWGAVALVLLSPAVFLLRLPGRTVRLRASRFRIDARQVEAEYVLVSRERRRFALPKVTAVASRQGLLDRIFGTCTFTFHSIGSGRPIVLPHVRARNLQVTSLVRRMGLTPGADTTVHSTVSPTLWFRGNPTAVIWTGICVVAATLLAVLHPLVLVVPAAALIGLLYRFGVDVWDAGSGRMEVGRDHVLVHRGRIRRSVFLAGFRQLREVKSRFYPLSRSGALEIRTAGGESSGLEYVADPGSVHLRLDSELLLHRKDGRRGRSELDSRPRRSVRPQARNDLIALAAICVVLFPLLLLYPFKAGLLILYHRRIRYVLEGDRVVESRGILVRQIRSILYDRIDSVGTSRGFLNGILKNGQVEISTATGAGAQLVMRNVPNEEDVADALHQGMESARAGAEESAGVVESRRSDDSQLR